MTRERKPAAVEPAKSAEAQRPRKVLILGSGRS